MSGRISPRYCTTSRDPVRSITDAGNSSRRATIDSGIAIRADSEQQQGADVLGLALARRRGLDVDQPLLAHVRDDAGLLCDAEDVEDQRDAAVAMIVAPANSGTCFNWRPS